MPTYGAITYRGGFYNNKRVNGADDRPYTAKDIRKPYDTIYSDGVLPIGDGTAGDTLKVTATVATGGMNISVGVGNAKVGGAWFENTGVFNITLDTAGSEDRYDCVIIRNDDSDEVRAPSIYIKTLNHIPTVADLTRNADIHELCIAYVRVPAFATEITDEDIIDAREDGSLCNVMSGVGAVVIRTYRNTYFSERANQTVIPIGIEQYAKNRDELIVIVEGRIFAEGSNYIIGDNSREITLTIGLPVVGTRIDFEVRKNVNAAGAETVVQEVAELRREMTVANKKLERHYYCNGVNDNENISKIVRDFMSLNFYHSMKLRVIGHFGFTQFLGGTGVGSNTLKLFDFGYFAKGTKPKIIIDFSECEEIAFLAESGKYTVVFGGTHFEIHNANIYTDNTALNTIVRVFDDNAISIKAVNCGFLISAYQNSLIAVTGSFENCTGRVANIAHNSYCFNPLSNGILRITGGEYIAYTGSSAMQSAVVGQSDAQAVSILYGVSAPTVQVSGFYQTSALLQFPSGGEMRCTDLISALPVNVTAGISEIRGTIAKSKPISM